MKPEYFEIELFEEESDKDFLFNFCRELEWKSHTLKIQGKEIPVPRLIEWFGDVDYTYSGITHHAKKMPEIILQVKEVLEKNCSLKLKKEVKFNSVLLNLYRNGRDSISFHSDDERELDEEPIIASVSLGATRRFIFKNKENGKLKEEIKLNHGHCLIMYGKTQKEWFHGIPKEENINEERINLTFRFTHAKKLR